MGVLNQAQCLLRITRTNDIVRRYFVVNGFDVVLIMLGLIIGFIFRASTDLSIIINTCLAAAIALGMSCMSIADLFTGQ